MWVLKANPKGLLNKGFVALMLPAACYMAISRLEPHANARTLHFNPAAQSLLDRARVSKSLLASKSSMGCPWTQGPGVQVLKKKHDGGVGAPFDN